jgi:phosphate butyryltransferase
MAFDSLSNLVEVAALKGRKRIAIAMAQDGDVLRAVKSASDAGFIIPILVGDRQKILDAAEEATYDVSGIEIIHEPDQQNACVCAVRLIHENKAELLMKGLVSTSVFVRAVLDKDRGLLEGSLLSHLAFFETPYYHKVLCVTDAALNIHPDLNEKADIVRNAIRMFHRLGIPNPKVAALAPVEIVNPKMEATVHADLLAQMNRRGQITGCIIEGPLALDNAVSLESAKHKGITSEVAGQVDILLTPDLNSGNILYKSLNFLGGAVSAAIVAGARVPVVLTSRADRPESKLLSMALASIM